MRTLEVSSSPEKTWKLEQLKSLPFYLWTAIVTRLHPKELDELEKSLIELKKLDIDVNVALILLWVCTFDEMADGGVFTTDDIDRLTELRWCEIIDKIKERIDNIENIDKLIDMVFDKAYRNYIEFIFARLTTLNPNKDMLGKIFERLNNNISNAVPYYLSKFLDESCVEIVKHEDDILLLSTYLLGLSKWSFTAPLFCDAIWYRISEILENEKRMSVLCKLHGQLRFSGFYKTADEEKIFGAIWKKISEIWDYELEKEEDFFTLHNWYKWVPNLSIWSRIIQKIIMLWPEAISKETDVVRLKEYRVFYGSMLQSSLLLMIDQRIHDLQNTIPDVVVALKQKMKSANPGTEIADTLWN